jgi:hypothetical protein
MKYLLLSLLLVAGCAPATSPVSPRAAPAPQPEQGTTSSGGGELIQTNDMVWFFSSGPIPYCVERSADYAGTQEELESLVATAARKWESFLDRYQIPGHSYRNENHQPLAPMARRFTAIGTCDSPSKQIRFRFGEPDELVRSANLQRTHLAAAVRGEYNFLTYQTGGTVWVSSTKYKTKERLLHVILHEMGHVLGFEHDSLPVMMREAVVNAALKDGFFERHYGEIESSDWPYRVESKRIEVSGRSFCHEAGLPEEERDRYNWNRNLPSWLLSAAKLPPSGCHRMILEMGDAEAWSLHIEPRGGTPIELTGRRESTRLRRPGGPVFLWNLHPYDLRRTSLDETSAAEISGYFLVAGRKIGALLDSRQRPVLKLYDSAAEKTAWWTSVDR